MRDNLLAVTEGDASAPRVVTKAINSAYFQAKRTTDQTVTNTAITRVQMSSEDYDPDSLYDNVTNYRFTPNKAGLYLVSLQLWGSNSSGVSITPVATIAKNGTGGTLYSGKSNLATTPEDWSAGSQALVQMNGTSDYLEAYVSQNQTTASYTVQGRFFATGICET
jgi:hypothetical protein